MIKKIEEEIMKTETSDMMQIPFPKMDYTFADFFLWMRRFLLGLHPSGYEMYFRNGYQS